MMCGKPPLAHVCRCDAHGAGLVHACWCDMHGVELAHVCWCDAHGAELAPPPQGPRGLGTAAAGCQ